MRSKNYMFDLLSVNRDIFSMFQTTSLSKLSTAWMVKLNRIDPANHNCPVAISYYIGFLNVKFSRHFHKHSIYWHKNKGLYIIMNEHVSKIQFVSLLTGQCGNRIKYGLSVEVAAIV